MSKFVILLAVIALVGAAPAPAPAPAPEDETKKIENIPILKSELNQGEDGSYTFLFESGDGSSRSEGAVISNPGTDEESIKVTGSYKYIDSDGNEIVVDYTADENGFVPIGTNIPKEISDAALAAKDLPNSSDAK